MKERRSSWNEHLSKTCRCIKCQRWGLSPARCQTRSLNLLHHREHHAAVNPINKRRRITVAGRGATIHYLAIRRKAAAMRGEMRTIWEAMWEATWPEGPTTLTSTPLARLDPFEVLHNSQNTNISCFSLHARLPPTPWHLLLLPFLPSAFPLSDHNHSGERRPRQTQPRIKSILGSNGATIPA